MKAFFKTINWFNTLLGLFLFSFISVMFITAFLNCTDMGRNIIHKMNLNDLRRAAELKAYQQQLELQYGITQTKHTLE